MQHNSGVVCPRCAKENDPEDKYCSRCGLEFAKVAKERPADDGEQVYCFWHPKEPTNLRCGKCDRPICTRCMINGPAGLRCKECGRSKVKVTARGLAHDASRPLIHTLGYYARQPLGMIFLLMLFSGVIRGCMVCRPEPREEYYEEYPPETTPPPAVDQRASAPYRIEFRTASAWTSPPKSE